MEPPNLAPLPLQLPTGPAALLSAQRPPEQPLPAGACTHLPYTSAPVAVPGEDLSPATRWRARSGLRAGQEGGGAAGYRCGVCGLLSLSQLKEEEEGRPVMAESGRYSNHPVVSVHPPLSPTSVAPAGTIQQRTLPRASVSQGAATCATRSPLCGSVSATPQVLPCVPAHLCSMSQVLAQGPPQPYSTLEVWGPS